MHPITALMIARQMDAERERRFASRRVAYRQLERAAEDQRRPAWIERIRLPRLGLSGL